MEITVVINDLEKINLIQLRKECDLAHDNGKICESLYEKLKNYNGNDAVIWAYKAMTSFLMANHVFNPFMKMHYFNEGKKWMNIAISKDENNLEVRFLRFALQVKTPEVLGYNKNIKEDKLFLYQEIKNNKVHDYDLLQRILKFIKDNKELFTDTELKEMKVYE